MTQELVGLGLTVHDARTGERLVANVRVYGGGEPSLNFTAGTLSEPMDQGYLFCNVGRGRGRIEISKAGYQTLVVEREFPGEENVAYALEPEASWRPTVDQMRSWASAVCIPGALPGIPYGDGARIWSPAYLCYDAGWRAKIRGAYRQRGYTHVEVIWKGKPYREDYPELAGDVALLRQGIRELLADRLIPCVTLTDDRSGLDLDYALAMMDQVPELVDCCMMVRYEANETLGNDQYYESYRLPNGDELRNVWVGEEMRFHALLGLKAKAIGCQLLPYAHWTPQHGSGGFPEAGWWAAVCPKDRGRRAFWYSPGTGDFGAFLGRVCQGHLSQDNQFDDPAGSAEGLQSAAIRLNPELGQQFGEWLDVDADVSAFEQQTTVLYRNERTEAGGIDFNTRMFATGTHGFDRLTGVRGFGDSGKA